IDDRFQYIRNFRPDLPYAQTINYNEQNPTMQVWRRLHAEGRLFGPPALFFAPTKPFEELYDVIVDPDTVHNLADDPTYASVRQRMRLELGRWMAETRDRGYLSEDELAARGIVTPLPQRGGGAGARGQGRGGRGTAP